MDKKRLEFYKKKLHAKREELLHLVAAVEEEGRAADEGIQDIADKAANSYTKEFLFNQSSAERVTLELVEDALKRINNGQFGECAHCGEEMQHKRLEAVPWARHCLACQEKQEQGLLEA